MAAGNSYDAILFSNYALIKFSVKKCTYNFCRMFDKATCLQVVNLETNPYFF